MAGEIHVAITGAAGRMGRRMIALAQESPRLRIIAALASPTSDALGVDAGTLAGVAPLGVPVTATLDADAMPHVMIDFSSPAGFRQWIDVCVKRRVNLLVGTTGLTPDDYHAIDEAGHEVAILPATNTSLGVAVLNHIAAEMTRMLGRSFDIEIVETHHRHKKDAPSGTAITLADGVLQARGLTRDSLVYGRKGREALRESNTVGMHSLRMGDVVGEHVVHFGGDGERLTLSHSATNRDTFARGALRAAEWLAGRGAGRYQIEDVLGIDR